MRPLLALCRLGLGLLYRHTGGMEQVRAERSGAVELLPGMELIFWLTQAETQCTEVLRNPALLNMLPSPQPGRGL
jgi:hypothetical protein